MSETVTLLLEKDMSHFPERQNFDVSVQRILCLFTFLLTHLSGCDLSTGTGYWCKPFVLDDSNCRGHIIRFHAAGGHTSKCHGVRSWVLQNTRNGKHYFLV